MATKPATKKRPELKPVAPAPTDQFANGCNHLRPYQLAKVGPFEVLIRHKQHYRLYTVTIDDVTVTKQMSYPSIGGICQDIQKAAELKLLRQDVASRWLRAALPERNAEMKQMAERNKKGAK